MIFASGPQPQPPEASHSRSLLCPLTRSHSMPTGPKCITITQKCKTTCRITRAVSVSKLVALIPHLRHCAANGGGDRFAKRRQRRRAAGAGERGRARFAQPPSPPSPPPPPTSDGFCESALALSARPPPSSSPLLRPPPPNTLTHTRRRRGGGGGPSRPLSQISSTWIIAEVHFSQSQCPSGTACRK